MVDSGHGSLWICFERESVILDILDPFIAMRCLMKMGTAWLKLLFCGVACLHALPGAAQDRTPSKDMIQEYKDLKAKGDTEGQKALVERAATAYLDKRLETLGSRKNMFPREVLERQLRSTVELVLEEGDNPDVRVQSAQWKWVDAGVAGVMALHVYDFRFLERSDRFSGLGMIEASLHDGYMESVQRALLPLHEARKDFLRVVDSSLNGVRRGGADSLEALKAIEGQMSKDSAILEAPGSNLDATLGAMLRLRHAYKGLRALRADAEIQKAFPSTSEGGRLLASLEVKERGYMAKLVALTKGKTVDPELKLAAATSWSHLEVEKLTKVQMQEFLKDRFQGASVPELSRYADMPLVPAAAPAKKTR